MMMMMITEKMLSKIAFHLPINCSGLVSLKNARNVSELSPSLSLSLSPIITWQKCQLLIAVVVRREKMPYFFVPVKIAAVFSLIDVPS